MKNSASNHRITRVELRNFKSIESVQLELDPLTIFVGRNGVGKSNIVDALSFVRDALSSTLEFAFRERGGIDEVRRKSLGSRPRNARIGIQVNTDQGLVDYGFDVGPVRGGEFRVTREICRSLDDSGETRNLFEVRNGVVKEWTLPNTAPTAVSDRLFLVAASGEPAFRGVHDILTRMTFHSLNPEVMKYPQRPSPGGRLARDGRNLASVIKSLQSAEGAPLDRVVEYLNAIGIPLSRIQHKDRSPLETIEVAQRLGDKNQIFNAMSLSDGTIRAMGILVSLVSGRGRLDGPTLIGIEEPETALHAAAVHALVEAMIEGSEVTQTLITCHSPDFLDHSSVSPDSIRVVVLENGCTMVGPLSPAKKMLMEDHLHTAGELLRLDQLTPDPDSIRPGKSQQSFVYGGAE